MTDVTLSGAPECVLLRVYVFSMVFSSCVCGKLRRAWSKDDTGVQSPQKSETHTHTEREREREW